MLTVACVLRSGGVYDAEWVRKLRDGVARNLTLPHRFVCLSDVDVPCERIPLGEASAVQGDTYAAPNGWMVHPRWWAKLELFRLTGPTLYFDLDTIIVGSLDIIAAYPHRFTALADFNSGRLGSGVLAWNGDHSFLIDRFNADPVKIAHHYDEIEPGRGRIGDQAYIEDRLAERGIEPDTFQGLFGKELIVSYKVHDCRDKPPARASVVCFHGSPKQDDIKTGWVAESWR